MTKKRLGGFNEDVVLNFLYGLKMELLIICLFSASIPGLSYYTLPGVIRRAAGFHGSGGVTIFRVVENQAGGQLVLGYSML